MSLEYTVQFSSNKVLEVEEQRSISIFVSSAWPIARYGEEEGMTLRPSPHPMLPAIPEYPHPCLAHVHSALSRSQSDILYTLVYGPGFPVPCSPHRKCRPPALVYRPHCRRQPEMFYSSKLQHRAPIPALLHIRPLTHTYTS